MTMRKITLLALSVAPADPTGYKLTASLYGQGDRSPSEVQEYGPLTWAELDSITSALVDRWRPGWEYGALMEQPPLWEIRDSLGEGR
jgi:hypothetical protein